MNDDSSVHAVSIPPVIDLVTHFYGLFSATQGLPVSHVILGPTDASVSRHKDTLLSLGRLAATVCSTAPRSGVFRFHLMSQTYVGLSLAEHIPFFVLLHISDNSCNEMILKCIQISHVLKLLYRSFLTSLGMRIERDLVAALNSASFAGSGLDEDGDTYCEDTFSVLEDHYIRPVLAIACISTLYTAPIDHSPQIEALLKAQDERRRRTSGDVLAVPMFPFSFGMYMLYSDAKDDFELPLAGAKDHTLLYHTDTTLQELLRFYRAIFVEDRRKLESGSMDLKYLLDSSLVLLLDGQSMALIVSATHKEDMYVAMRVPGAWLDRSAQVVADPSSCSSHVLLAKVSTPAPVHMSRAGVTLLPLAALGAGPTMTSTTTADVAAAATATTTAPLLECWTALLSRLLLYLPIAPPSCPSPLPPPTGQDTQEGVAEWDYAAFSVEQVTALLLPDAPDSQALGGLHPHPPHTHTTSSPHSPSLSLNSGSDVNHTGTCSDRPVSRPIPSLHKSSSSSSKSSR